MNYFIILNCIIIKMDELEINRNLESSIDSGKAKKSKKSKKKKIRHKKEYRSRSISFSYKYTHDEERNIWLENVYPLGFMLINKVSKIPWNEYKFKGETECLIHEEKDDEEVLVKKNLYGKATLMDVPYYLFGGAACELYSKIYPSIIDITSIVDPTADIDIKLHSPIFSIKNERDILYDLVMIEKNGYTQLNDHFTEWLFKEVFYMCLDIEKFFNTSIFSLPTRKDIHKDFELKNADMKDYVGPLLISRVLIPEQKMIKIQVSSKVYEITNHLLEFILPINEELENGGKKQIGYYKPYKYETPYSNIYVENPVKLFQNQLKALEDRYLIFSYENLYDYKLYNHCARIIYISYLLVYLREMNLIKALSPTEVSGFKKYITEIKNLNDICKPFSKYDIQKIITTNIQTLLKK